MHMLKPFALVALLVGVVALASMPARAQQQVYVCNPIVSSTTGALSCVNVSASNPLPVVAEPTGPQPSAQSQSVTIAVDQPPIAVTTPPSVSIGLGALACPANPLTHKSPPLC